MVVSGALLCGITLQVSPLSETAAQGWSVAGGLIIGVASGVGVYYLMKKNSEKDNEKNSIVVPVLVGLAAGGLSWYVLNWWLSSMTPQGRIAAADALIASVEGESLLATSNADELIIDATTRFASDWELISARDILRLYNNNLDNARQKLNDARTEDSNVANQCEELSKRIQGLVPSIKNHLEWILSHPHYAQQLVLFRSHQEAERQRTHERQLQWDNQSHDSWERDKERRDKERRMNSALSQPPGAHPNININI